MALLYLSEYSALTHPIGRGAFQAPQEPATVDQPSLTISASSSQSSAFSSTTMMVRVEVDSTCSIQFGLNPTASTLFKRLQAGQTEYFGVVGGHKLAVITNV